MWLYYHGRDINVTSVHLWLYYHGRDICGYIIMGEIYVVILSWERYMWLYYHGRDINVTSAHTVSARVNAQGVLIGKVLKWGVGVYVGGGVYGGGGGGGGRLFLLVVGTYLNVQISHEISQKC